MDTSGSGSSCSEFDLTTSSSHESSVNYDRELDAILERYEEAAKNEDHYLLKMELNRAHFRAIIYYNFQRQLSQQESLAELLSVFGNEAPHHLSDDSRVGAPKTAEHRHVTYREIKASLKISKTLIQKIKLVSRWIPHLQTEEQKSARVNWCEEKPTKVIPSRSVSKRMVATFVSKAGHIVTIPLIITELGKINPERRIILHQDNASSHTAQKTRHPDLSPNDFFTFPKIKNRLRGQRFESPEEAVDTFKNGGLDLPANEWNKCFESWFERMQMCINLRREVDGLYLWYEDLGALS
ncbi:unnamed protein product [Acanthoscelides obtectus]|uniref:Transposase n=1 Tax=Acanthoscelides obtectus TaxID=200917 RepID=A0A9P0JRX4_ACAOB|nr:unnamed protein product [Acanthoscelides obtectus]CAK1679459.1 hypothetical protein AOBTE_LOCUS32262 [Acanthoscelides obtectus]